MTAILGVPVLIFSIVLISTSTLDGSAGQQAKGLGGLGIIVGGVMLLCSLIGTLMSCCGCCIPDYFERQSNKA
eukprot:CAMPEP_0184644520 /NCGR_PEP_ID=MMETSP0308-20130426/1227_1 /TAXON_ID=38269 /ORGANISM="Gloeochaete witrockiana, Strain SAG 46.84" /LENGTH=72 /DNA_ID=CAMNT_0027073099 /DNA_START=413 /DNA_END=631 /DNA_ORIENTATION=+